MNTDRQIEVAAEVEVEATRLLHRPTRDLERRLVEAEATIAALVSGEIDAVVDPKSSSPVLLSKAQDALRESEERYRRIVETTNDGIGMLDADLKITFANERLTEMFGYSSAEMLGRSLFDFMKSEEAAAMRAGLRGVGRASPGPSSSRSGKRVSDEVEVEFQRKDGSSIYVLVVTIRDDAATTTTTGNSESVGSLAMFTDTTRRRRVEATLRKSEARYRRIVETTNQGVWTIDAQGRTSFMNERMAFMLGYERNEVIGVPLLDFIVDDLSRDRVLQDRETKRQVELRLKRKDGEAIWVLLEMAPTYGESATPATDRYDGSFAMVMDVTERKKSEEARRLAEERKSAVVDTALDAVVGMDQDGVIIEFNPAAEQTFGHKREEAVGRSLAQLLIPSRFRTTHTRGLERYLKTGTGPVIGKRIEMSAMRRDGVEIPIELSISQVGSSSGRGVGSGHSAPTFVGFIRDISERKRVEGELAARMCVIALGADVGMALTTGETLRAILQRCCEAIVRHLGASFARIWTLNPTSKLLELRASAGMYTHIDGPHGSVVVDKTLKIGRIAEERQPHLCNDVQTDPLFDQDWARREGMRSFAGHPLVVGGDLVGVMAMFGQEPLAGVVLEGLTSIADPISVRIRGKLAEQENIALEEQLRQSQKMDAVGRLAGGIAHDFNNALSVILSYGDLILADLQVGDPLRADVEEIHKAGVRAAGLTRQLLMFSRQQVIDPTVLDLNDVLSKMTNMLRRILGEDVELNWAGNGISVGHVCVDPGGIEQVIMNLAVNARDAMPVGGKLTLETSSVILDDAHAASLSAKPGSYVLLAVTDTGTGMAKETLAKIFDPFFTTKESGRGTGLGLSTVFGIVKQGGGNIFVHSELDVGTTFKIYLPRVDDAEAGLLLRKNSGASTKTATPTPRGSETILLIEDEQQVRDVARGILKRHGYTILEASTAAGALFVCEQHVGPIHLLLTDVVMPGTSGPELAKRLTAIRPEITVLCMSGYMDDSTLRHGVVHAELEYLQKPLTVESLTRKVRAVLDAAASCSPRAA